MIKNNGKETFGKMVINGPKTHPLFKFLKRNCEEFYSHDTKSVKKNINKSIGMFLITKNQ